jgi:hypothetical protein
MNLTLKKIVRKAQRAGCLALAGMFMVVLTGCQTLGGGVIPPEEYENFTPKSPEKRIMKEVTVRWEIRNDVAQYCARSIGMGREQAYFTPPVACAVWQVDKKECVIVTGSPTSHVALGHEIRHCFEGHFH